MYCVDKIYVHQFRKRAGSFAYKIVLLIGITINKTVNNRNNNYNN